MTEEIIIKARIKDLETNIKSICYDIEKTNGFSKEKRIEIFNMLGDILYDHVTTIWNDVDELEKVE